MILVPLALVLLGLAPPTPAARLAQEDQAIFDAPLVVLDDGRVPFRHLSDLDGDGDVDALGYVDNGSYARWTAIYQNDGTGVFTRIGGASSFGFFDLVASGVGDFDGDGIADIVQSEWEYPDARLEFFLSGASFGRTTLTDGPPRIAALGSGDLDGDGRDELLYWEATGQLGIGFGHPGVDWETRSITNPFLNHVQALQALDGDGDGDLDILVLTNAGLGFVDVNMDDLDGAPLLMGSSWPHGLGPMPMADAGDVDGDGDVDVALFGMGEPAEYRLLRRTGAATWQLEAALLGGPAEFLYDVDADGDLDGVCCGGGGTPSVPGGDDPTDFQIALNDGTGAFADSFQIPGVGSPQLAGVADVDGDGDVDLVAGRCIYYARGPIRRPRSAEPGFRSPAVSHPRELSDADGDGDIDIGFSLTNVERNDGTGSFDAQAPDVAANRQLLLEGPGYPGDFDGDGDVDLLVEMRPSRAPGPAKHIARASLGANRNGARMWLLANDGDGGLLDGGPASPPGIVFALDSMEAYASLTADLDLDGDLDLVTRTVGSPYVELSRLWLNAGGGMFVPLKQLYDEKVEHIADLDLDGVPDLITSRAHDVHANRSQPSVHRGTLYAALPVYTPLPDLIGPYQSFTGSHPLALGDVTGDGYLDLGYVHWIHPDENGTTTYSYEPLLLVDTQSTGGYGYSASTILESDRALWGGAFVAFGDLDSDGTLDVLSGPRLAAFNDVATLTVVHVNDPSLSLGFEPIRVQVVEPGVLADVDGDGDLDMLGEVQAENVSIP